MINNANDSSTSGVGHEQEAMPKSETAPSGRSMTALDILSSCAMALSEQSGSTFGGQNAVQEESKVPMPPAVVSPTTPGVSPVSPSTMTTGTAKGEVATITAEAKPSSQIQTRPPPIQKKALVRARSEVSACSDDSAKDSATLNDTDNPSMAASSSSGTLSSRIGDAAQPITQRLRSSMEKSRRSLKQLQEWDRRLGLPKSSAHTCVKTERSRKQLLEGKILKKWDGTPLISFERDANGAILVKTGNKPKQRNKKKAKKESSGESGQEKVDGKEEEVSSTMINSDSTTQASTSPSPPIDNKKKKGRGSR